ncbi:MAG TPA: recombination mediator RecR [Elusimicrobiota bacterium]|nr:recombination mediator RecR [Elusimicrobiota bacterium]
MSRPWDSLVASIQKLPGIGPKMAERIALHLFRSPAHADELTEAIRRVQNELKRCDICGDITEINPCPRCDDASREKNILCVVEEIGDLYALERSRAFRGQYHVLGGALSALDGIGPDELRLDALLGRIRQKQIHEVILATNPTAEGETTATYIADLLKDTGVRVTRLAYGLPSGSNIQYADDLTLVRALEGRQKFD